jgi:hypothetical protein
LGSSWEYHIDVFWAFVDILYTKHVRDEQAVEFSCFEDSEHSINTSIDFCIGSDGRFGPTGLSPSNAQYHNNLESGFWDVAKDLVSYLVIGNFFVFGNGRSGPALTCPGELIANAFMIHCFGGLFPFCSAAIESIVNVRRRSRLK